MPDTSAWISAVRNSHERLAGLLAPLSADQLTAKSYAKDWSIADVASHLGSQAEIFAIFLDAGLTGNPPGGMEVMQPIWDRWNALPPAEQAAQSTAYNEKFVTKLEGVAAEQLPFTINMFGGEQDLGGFAAIRFGEHAIHTWDVAVALDPTATLSPEAVELQIDRLIPLGRTGKPIAGAAPVAIHTVDPERSFVITLDPAVVIAEAQGPGPLELPAESFIRLIYGRLDPANTPAGVDESRLAPLRGVFTGF